MGGLREPSSILHWKYNASLQCSRYAGKSGFHVFEDREHFDGIHPSAVRDRFSQRIVTAPQREQGKGKCPARSQPYNHCLQEALQSDIRSGTLQHRGRNETRAHIVTIDFVATNVEDLG